MPLLPPRPDARPITLLGYNSRVLAPASPGAKSDILVTHSIRVEVDRYKYMSQFKPDRHGSYWRTSLPVIMTSFIGRDEEAASAADMLSGARLVTLTGAAGCGKTRLAVHVASAMSADYRDGAHFIDLTRLDDSSLIPQTVARTLHIAEQPGRSWTEALLAGLQDRQLLLVLDNCEHMLRASADLAGSLLNKTAVSLLATSRESLSVAGESVYPLRPMALPPSDAATSDISQFDAVQLFVERARAIVPAFDITADNAPVIASICHKLDGIPLAIELASARVNVLAVDQIAARLDDRFALLSVSSNITHSHHETLQTAIEWSHDLLSEDEQTLLRRLAVFAGGFSLAAAESVCAGDNVRSAQILDLLASLVNKSLVVAFTLNRNEARYDLLETIQRFGQAKLESAGELAKLCDRHLQHILSVTEETEPKLRGKFQRLWLDWLESEFDNVRAALAWALERDDIQSGLRIVIAMYQFWVIRDYAEEGFAWTERLMERAGDNIPPLVQAQSLAYASILAGFRGIGARQIDYGRKAAALAEALGDEGQSALIWARAGQAYAKGRPAPLLPPERLALPMALAGQAYGARAEGDYQTEYQLYKRNVELYREIGDPYYLGMQLITCSFSAMSLQKYGDARAMLDEGLTLLRKVGDPYRISMTLNFSGDLARLESRYERARSAYQECIALMRQIGAVRDLASSLHNLAHTCLRLGDVECARDRFDESAALHMEQNNVPGLAECLIGYGAMAIVGDLPAAGARLLAAAVAIGGERVATTWAATKMEYEHYLARAHAGLSDAAFEDEQAIGRGLSLEQAIEFAQDVATRVASLASAPRSPDELTLREREVTALIAQAKSNDEIAEELVLSKRTVEKHIANIRSKLGFSNRTQIVRWALENMPNT